jgi:iron complex transport system permease protein
MTARRMMPFRLAGVLLVFTVLLTALGVAVGSMGWEPPWGASAVPGAIVWDIRLPRTLGAWFAGALLGLSGAIAQGLFRNPLADPFLLGSASGATLGVAVLLAWLGVSPAAAGIGAQLGMTGFAFAGAAGAVLITLTLAQGVQHTLRLLLAGVVVGVVLGALASLVALWSPDILRAMQTFMLGTTSFLGWSSVAMTAVALAVALVLALPLSRALDALSLGETTALSLGVPLPVVRGVLVVALALSTGAAVAHVGLVAFVGLAAPHLVRTALKPAHRSLLALSAITGGALLLAADVLARWLMAPQELPVGILTAVLGGGYLLVLMHRRSS